MGTTLIEEPNTPRRGSAGTTMMGGSRGGTKLIEPQGNDPVVGWLVITAGPGRGNSLELGYGMNIVGRGHDNRIVLDYGDDKISEDDHFRIAYDAENREFHLIPGRGTNLLYIGAKPLLGPQPLATGSDFKVGDTSLRFVALCGSDWNWSPAEQG